MRRLLPLIWLSAIVVAWLTLPSGGAAHSEEPFDYFRNSWSVIGLKDYRDGARVTPDNRLLLAAGGEVRLRFGASLSALSRQQTKTLMDGWLPIVLLHAAEGPVRYEFTLWATPLPTVPNWRAAFDWPTDGENFLNWIVVRATNTGQETAESRVAVQVTRDANTDEQVFAWSLAPAATQRAVVTVPFHPVDDPQAWAGADADLWLERTRAYWRQVVQSAAQIVVPCRKSTEALWAAHVCQLIANDHGELHGGEGFYDEFFIRDGGYQIMQLEEAGLTDVTAKAIQPYLARQRPDGRFESQAGQLDANGQALWVLWQYYKITGDRTWLAAVYPQMQRAVDWLQQARREAPSDSPYAGLLPNAVADGEYLWDGAHHIVGYDFWNLRGLLCTADAARALGRTEAADRLQAEAAAYRAAIDAAWRRTGLPHFPPSWEQAGTHWGNTETLWPTELFLRDDPRVSALIQHARHEHGGGFAEGTIRWLGVPGAIHPYMSAYTTMTSLARGEHQAVVEDYYWYLLHSTATHAFPEGIFFQRRFAWADTIPHVTGASNFALMLRHMLVHEQGDELHLLAAVPDGWLAHGKEILVQRAPTHFGEMNLRVRGTAEGVQVEFTRPQREAPRRVVLHLPASRPLVGSLPDVTVQTRSDQDTPWDFPTVVALYRERYQPAVPPIPGLVSLPVTPALRDEQCQSLDLSVVANTDPLSAPFGVPQPGKLLFTGMPLGRQTVGGVPFHVIHPAANQGRGLVVLHSPHAPPEIAWPHEVEIAVGCKGRRLYFLGNVHGWSPQDAGAGPWGAVAEYVIHYVDGQTQTVPLITGRTADEWTAGPEADEAYVGLRGDPWHLNMLGVELRDEVVEKIVFRDLDTPAAPVLVAATLEK
jgi:hypothetical protein